MTEPGSENSKERGKEGNSEERGREVNIPFLK